MIAPSSFSSSLSSDQQTRLGLLLLSAMAWPQCPQLCLLIKTHQLLSLKPHPPYKAIHRPTQQLTACQKTKVDDRPVVVYWVVGSETAEKNVLVANTRVCLPSILPFHAPSPADHLTIVATWPATPTRKCPKEFPKMPQKSTRHVDTYKKSCKTDLSKALNTSPLFALRVKGEINLCSFSAPMGCALSTDHTENIRNISLTLLISIRETQKNIGTLITMYNPLPANII